jgi:hypothetical protein
MLIARWILLRIVVLAFISCEAGLLFFFGNKIIKPHITIDSSNSFLYRGTLVNAIGTALFLCFFLYILYSSLISLFKIHSLIVKVSLAFGCFILTTWWFSAFAGPGDSLNLYVVKNLIAYAITAISIPFIEKCL